jgi:hypothetical protein
MILFDISPLSGGIGIGLAVFFFLICVAIAFIAYRMLSKTFKMAVRMVIVGVILAVALVGGVALLWLSYSSPANPSKPPAKTAR